MSSPSDDLVLLERVFLRLGSTETDEQLENALGRFLTPVLLKLASPDERVRKKVMELLIHVNKRVKTRPLIQLPVESLLQQYADPAATAFVTNFTIIYLKLGFPRLSIDKQVELVPNVLVSLKNKPQTHIDSMLMLLLPLLGKVKVPTDPAQAPTLFGLDEQPELSKNLLGILLDVLLLPYGTINPQNDPQQVQGNNSAITVPPGMSEQSFKRVTDNNPLKADELEEIKLGIEKFLSYGIFKNEDILLHLIVASSDTRFAVANFADTELRKIVGTIDWASPNICRPIYLLFLGSQGNIKAEIKKNPASTRIRLKLLTYLCRAKENAFMFPLCIQVVFNSLYGNITNTRLKGLALNFTNNIIQGANKEELDRVSKVLLQGLVKYTSEGEENQRGQAYILIGLLALRFPHLVFHDIAIFEMFLQNFESANTDLKLQIREGFLNLILAYNPSTCEKDEVNRGNRLDLIFALLKSKTISDDMMLRFVTVRALSAVFPSDFVAAKALLLQATGDIKDEVSSEAFKALYGSIRKADYSKLEEIDLPEFDALTDHIYRDCDVKNEKATTFSMNIYKEIIMYIRLCLYKKLRLPLTREINLHPLENTPLIYKHLNENYKFGSAEGEHLLKYLELCKRLLLTSPCAESICCIVEIIGCSLPYATIFSENFVWIRDNLLSSRNAQVSEYAALLFAILMAEKETNSFAENIDYLLKQTNSSVLEVQNGAILAIGNTLKFKIQCANGTVDKNMIVNSVKTLDNFLLHQNQTLANSACTSLGLIGSCTSLFLENGKVASKDSPEAKKLKEDLLTKADVVEHLMVILKNQKSTVKVKEKAASSLGTLCVGDKFPHSKLIIEGLLETSKESKDVELHFTIGESLVMCIQGIWSPEARNKWTKLPAEFTVPENETGPDELLSCVLEELLKLLKSTHPCSRQASCIWMLAVVKNCGKRKAITDRLESLQGAFLSLLSESNDIVQDVAAKGLCVLYDTYKSEELLSALVRQLTSGTRQAAQVSSDTQLFDEGQLGKSPSGGNLTTYKELCSLASDLNKPDLIYQFMHLANHNTIWNSKKGAAFGFSSIAERCGEDLKNYLPEIVPKLYRYQYDPSPNIQNSMHNIWRVLVSEPKKVVEQYYDEILKDLLQNLNSGQYRVRQSCCLALQDFLKGSGNKSIYDCIDSMEEMWSKLFRVMDDHHEATRKDAVRTATILSKLCTQACNEKYGKDATKMVEILLPPFLNNGILSPVAEIRLISLQTISELINTSGKQVKPFLPVIIPALLRATGELEPAKFSYISAYFGGQSQDQEVVDGARASFARSHFTTKTVIKCMEFADSTILEQLVPKIVELMKQSVTLGTRVACTECITLLVVHLGKEMQPFSGKLLLSLTNGLLDRNAVIRKSYADAIGHVVGIAKESSIDKLFAKFQHWYFEREDVSVKSALGFAIKAIGERNQDVLKRYSTTILPLVLFAMHADKNPESESMLEVWEEIWSDNTPGTEGGIRQNIDAICDIIKNALDSPSWTIKAQAANTISTVATKLGTSMEPSHLTVLVNILLSGLGGRTWSGKEKLLKALASLCLNCQEILKSKEVNIDLSQIVDSVLKECRKNEIVYKIESLKCLGDILSSLEIDRFDEVYNIVQNIILDEKDEDEEKDETESNTKRENTIKLKTTAYDVLGKSWPKDSKETQEKYREMFVQHCASFLPKITRSLQVSVLEALYGFVEKLKIFNEDRLSESDERSLTIIMDNIIVCLDYSLGIPKYTRFRKEGLNIVMCLLKKLKHRESEYKKLKDMFTEKLPLLEEDNNPEIKSRIRDIKKFISE